MALNSVNFPEPIRGGQGEFIMSTNFCADRPAPSKETKPKVPQRVYLNRVQDAWNLSALDLSKKKEKKKKTRHHANHMKMTIGLVAFWNI